VRRGAGLGRLFLAIAILGCGPVERAAPPAEMPRAIAAPPAAMPEPAAAICGADRLRTVRARFRAKVAIGGEETVTDGVLLVRRPGAIRVKLFGIAGFTVHDATWRGDASLVRGRVDGLDRDRPLSLAQTPDRPAEDAAARFSLVLWSLWQPRCLRAPRPVAAAPATYALDPASAQARSREVSLSGGAVAGERLVLANGDDVAVAYSGDGSGSVVPAGVAMPAGSTPLPRRIEIAMPSAGWTAAVEVSEYDVDEPLDEGLFALPEVDPRP
jgi:hypothetical protein